MSKYLHIRWEVDDGYAGGSAPQHLQVPVSEILECDSVDDAMEIVEVMVQDDFANKVSWHYINPDELRIEIAELLKDKAEGA